MIANHPPATDSVVEVALAGQPVQLLASSALFWPAQNTLFIADLHFGKAAAFRRFGIAAPDGTLEDLERLATLLRDTRAQRLIVLGDFFHARSGLSESMLAALGDWRRHRLELELVLVRGNHDRSAGDPPAEWEIRCQTEPWHIGPFACCHVPCESDSGYVISGHVHPGISLSERNGARLRAPCFVVGPRRAILPAFGSFTGLASVDCGSDDALFAVNGQSIVRV